MAADEPAGWKRWLSGEDRLSAAIIAAGAMAWVVLIICFQKAIVMGPLQVMGLTEALSEPVWNVYATVMMYLPIVLPGVVWMALTGLWPRPGSAADAGYGLIIGTVGFAVTLGMAALGAQASLKPTPIAWLPLFLSIIQTLLQSGGEEFIFRGWIQPVLMRRYGPWLAIAVSAVSFGLIHVLAGMIAPLSLVNICLAGALFGLLAWRTGGMLAPVMAHFAWNWAEGVLFGMYPNPGVDVWSAVWDIDLTGSALWTGGHEGMNASLAETFVLLALCVPLLLWRRRTDTVAVMA